MHSNKPILFLSEHIGAISGLKALEWEATEDRLGHRESLVAGDIRDPSKKVPRKTVTKNTGSL